MKPEKCHNDTLAVEALSKLRIIGQLAPIGPEKDDCLIRGVIAYNQLIREAIQEPAEESTEDHEDQAELERQNEHFQHEILAALKKAHKFAKKQNFKEAIILFEELERKGIPEGKYFKGMVIMAENQQNFFIGLQSMVEACSETMNENLLENMLKLLEAAQKVGLFRKVNELKYNVDRNQLGNFLQMFLESCQNVHQQKFAAAKLLEALRQYYK